MNFLNLYSDFIFYSFFNFSLNDFKKRIKEDILIFIPKKYMNECSASIQRDKILFILYFLLQGIKPNNLALPCFALFILKTEIPNNVYFSTSFLSKLLNFDICS